MQQEVEFRAAYADTDQMGFVHHSNYLKYLEFARWEALRKMGLTYKEIEGNDILIPVIDVKMRFIKPIYYDDLVRIKVIFKLISPTKLVVDYTINNEMMELVHTASTTLAFLRKQSAKPCRVPVFMREIFNRQSVVQEKYNLN